MLEQTEQKAEAVKAETDKEIAVLNREIAALRDSLQSLDRAVASQREQARTVADKATQSAGASEKAIASARGSAVIGIAARLDAAAEAGQPFAKDLALLGPLVQGDDKLAAVAAKLQPFADKGVPSQVTLEESFPAVAKAALADDLADDSLGERVLGKLRNLVSLRRVGDVPGDSTEAKLARAETALHTGDVARAVEIVKSLPDATRKATAAWLARAEAYLAAKAALQELAAAAAATMGTR
ncbi:COG4223 family protein [Reyranella sp.]|uniref:COG4223 family protein n=1 Tax=Reyranella sp. TaxID=1929291 RepID=UPI003BA95847